MDQAQRAFDFKETSLMERVESLQEALAQERELRETWIQKFEAEQKNSSNANYTSIELRAKIQDMEL